jgi:hypothetical protein
MSGTKRVESLQLSLSTFKIDSYGICIFSSIFVHCVIKNVDALNASHALLIGE